MFGLEAPMPVNARRTVPSNRVRMILCAVVVGACFAVGLPALFAHHTVVWGVCCLVSLPASYGIRVFGARAERDTPRD
jgi:hypothetical protein